MNLILCVLLSLIQGKVERAVPYEESKRVWVYKWDDLVDEGELVSEIDRSVCYKTSNVSEGKVISILHTTNKDRVFYSKKAAYAFAVDKMSEDILDKRKKINKLMEDADKP